MHVLPPKHVKPTFRDWALAAIGTMFVLIGLLILPENRDLGVSTIVMFGACAAMSIWRIVRKLRNARQHIASVQVIGGRRIAASRLRFAAISACFLAFGSVLIVFSDRPPLYITMLYCLIAGIGIIGLVMFSLGRDPGAYLEFTPAGLEFGYRSWAALLAWDRIASVAAGDVHDNPALFLRVDSPETLQVTPRDKHEKFMKYVRQSRSWLGADIVIMSMQYGIDSQVLFAAITRYMEDRDARAELEPMAMPNGASLAHPLERIAE